MTPLEQLGQWAIGINLHDHERGQCCPDFACCSKVGGWPYETRQRFLRAYSENDVATVRSLLFGALIEQLAHTGRPVEVLDPDMKPGALLQ